MATKTLAKMVYFTLPSAGPLFPPLSRDNAAEIIAMAERMLEAGQRVAENPDIKPEKVCALLSQKYRHPIPSLDYFSECCAEAIAAAQSVLPMELYDWQEPHFERVKSILSKRMFYADVTQMGLGKTIVGCQLAKTLGLDLLVVGPLTVETNWAKTAYRCGVKLLGFLSYEGLRSTKNHQPSHGLLVRRDGKPTVFQITEAFREMVAAGVLLIFDESQKAKNESEQAHACQALACAITLLTPEQTKSRVGFLSGTPFDKEEHAVSLYRAVGLLQEERLAVWDIQTRTTSYEGIDKLHERFKLMFKDNPNLWEVTAQYKQIRENKEKIGQIRKKLYQWLIKIVAKECFSSMVAPKIEFPLDIKSGYYKLDEEARLKVEEYFADLREKLKHDPNKDTVKINTAGLAALGYFMEKIEFTMAPTFARLAKEILDRDPRAQVAIFLTYHRAIDLVKELLAEYRPLSMTGKDPGKKRPKIMDSFQSGESRVIVAGLTVGGIGVNLHDTHGGRQRYELISPDYKSIALHQAVYRVYRVGIKSPAVVRLVFAEGAQGYKNLLDCLARKATVLGELTPEQVNAGVKYPGQYDDIYERPPNVTDKADTAIFGNGRVDESVLRQLAALKL